MRILNDFDMTGLIPWFFWDDCLTALIHKRHRFFDMIRNGSLILAMRITERSLFMPYAEIDEIMMLQYYRQWNRQRRRCYTKSMLLEVGVGLMGAMLWMNFPFEDNLFPESFSDCEREKLLHLLTAPFLLVIACYIWCMWSIESVPSSHMQETSVKIEQRMVEPWNQAVKQMGSQFLD